MAALKTKRKLLSLFVLILLAAIVYLAWPAAKPSDKTASGGPAPSAANTSEFDKSKYSLSDPVSIWIVVNKQRPLKPLDYAPADLVVPDVPLRVPGNESMQLRRPAAAALEAMFSAAKAANVPLMLSSGYRSYNYQVGLYGGYVKSVGQASADAVSARPGYSEHQTGLAADIEPLDQKCDINICFANLPAGKWLAANCYKYGFILRYPSDKTKVTGYDYEPWHVRYIGTDLSLELHKLGIRTLEEFFGLPAAPDY